MGFPTKITLTLIPYFMRPGNGLLLLCSSRFPYRHYRHPHDRSMGRTEILSVAGLRGDGRRPNELRRVHGRLGMLSHVDGSAYLEQGNTKVLVTVSGPRESPYHLDGPADRCRLELHWNTAAFSAPEKKRKNDRRTIDWSAIIKEGLMSVLMLHLIPNSQIDVGIHVLQMDGSVPSCVMNAVTLALIDAGIPMSDYMCAATISLYEDQPLLDINHLEESAFLPVMTMAVLPRTQTISLLHMETKLAIDKVPWMIEAAKLAASQMYTIMDQLVLSKK